MSNAKVKLMVAQCRCLDTDRIENADITTTDDWLGVIGCRCYRQSTNTVKTAIARSIEKWTWDVVVTRGQNQRIGFVTCIILKFINYCREADRIVNSRNAAFKVRTMQHLKGEITCSDWSRRRFKHANSVAGFISSDHEGFTRRAVGCGNKN